jgi:hypothetical protein
MLEESKIVVGSTDSALDVDNMIAMPAPPIVNDNSMQQRQNLEQRANVSFQNHQRQHQHLIDLTRDDYDDVTPQFLDSALLQPRLLRARHTPATIDLTLDDDEVVEVEEPSNRLGAHSLPHRVLRSDGMDPRRRVSDFVRNTRQRTLAHPDDELVLLNEPPTVEGSTGSNNNRSNNNNNRSNNNRSNNRNNNNDNNNNNNNNNNNSFARRINNNNRPFRQPDDFVLIDDNNDVPIDDDMVIVEPPRFSGHRDRWRLQEERNALQHDDNDLVLLDNPPDNVASNVSQRHRAQAVRNADARAAFRAEYLPESATPLYELFSVGLVGRRQPVPSPMNRGQHVMHALPNMPPSAPRKRTKRIRLARVKRQPKKDSTCPICLGEFHNEPSEWCQYGCGANVHVVCMDQWRSTLSSKREKAAVTCVLCRTDWKVHH